MMLKIQMNLHRINQMMETIKISNKNTIERRFTNHMLNNNKIYSQLYFKLEPF